MSLTVVNVRATALAVVIVVALALAQNIAPDDPDTARTDSTRVLPLEEPLIAVDGVDPHERAFAVSRALFASSEVAVVAPADDPGIQELAASAAAELRVPALPDTDDLDAELDRLGVTHVLRIEDAGGAEPGVSTVEPDEAAVDRAVRSLAQEHPTSVRAATDAVVLTRDASADRLAIGTAHGAEVVEIPEGDPRAGDAAQRLREIGETPTVALGDGFVDLAYTLDVVRNAPEQPGGGHLVLPGRHLIALYGHPTTPALGLLGEQDPAGSVARVRDLVAEYEQFGDETIVPTFEIIASIASAEAGPDGDYSRETSVADLRPLVDAAADAEVYVILDLQPGRTDFLTQAQRYEELLLEPHVGLALDPEWRLEPDQVHLRQIGSVSAAEINRTADWLATLTRENGLPQKAFVLHQFTPRMITDRSSVDTSHPELATIIHVDGQGSQPAKQDTWTTLMRDPPPGVSWGWKNFIDEDDPMLTPAQTWDVSPRPDLITYQ